MIILSIGQVFLSVSDGVQKLVTDGALCLSYIFVYLCHRGQVLQTLAAIRDLDLGFDNLHRDPVGRMDQSSEFQICSLETLESRQQKHADISVDLPC